MRKWGNGEREKKQRRKYQTEDRKRRYKHVKKQENNIKIFCSSDKIANVRNGHFSTNEGQNFRYIICMLFFLALTILLPNINY